MDTPYPFCSLPRDPPPHDRGIHRTPTTNSSSTARSLADYIVILALRANAQIEEGLAQS